MKNKLKSLGLAIGILVALFSFQTSSASAEEYPFTKFQTEDGRYEKTIITTSTLNDVEVIADTTYRINKNSGIKTEYWDISPLRVRLCSVSTGSCTSSKAFFDGEGSYNNADFINMKPGKYYVDITDTLSNYRFEGIVAVNLYNYY
ncbi:hypothetical protein [Bacillus gaemokensis]|uniref:Uncharacterized protein n=1 Tax=Bacillus gaemokensis TaxID=574375 RepID=A0A073K9F2_9BACI|nr:hypothetical protein [Bacillus gaemokensis]KEK23072.1 hypothetical protein BAGA_14685 [Bacillus gaemokensis]KYG37741.1 hypothetical protein AZF08_22640 [Bacillus gaemokensis]